MRVQMYKIIFKNDIEAKKKFYKVDFCLKQA